MAEKGIPAAGTTLAVDFGSGSGAVANVTSVSLSGWSRPTIDITSLSDTVRKYILGIQEPGEISCEIFYDPASHGGFATVLGNGEECSIVLTFADEGTSTLSCDAYLTGFEVGVSGVDDAVTASATFKVTGEITL